MSNNEQQVLNWAGGVALKRAAATVDDKSVTNEAHPARKCSTCGTIIGVNAVTCDECWHHCMEGTSP